MYTIIIDDRLEKKLNKLSRIERARITRINGLFEEHGFLLNELYLKKLTDTIWELRPGTIRLLFGVIENKAIIVHFFIKKTQKTPARAIELAEMRFKEYL